MMIEKWFVKLLLVFIPIIALVAWFSQAKDQIDEHLFVYPKQGPFRVSVTTTGSLQAKAATSILGPEAARQVHLFQMKIQQLIPEGTQVKEGDFVAELDRSEIAEKIEEVRLALQQSESEYVQAKLDTSLSLSTARAQLVRLRSRMELAKIKKAESIYEPKSEQRQAEMDLQEVINEHELESKSYLTQTQLAKGSVQRAFNRLEHDRQIHAKMVDLEKQFTILAPASGMVIYKRDWQGSPLTTGGQVNAWDPVIATLPDFSLMESITYVNEVDIEKIKVGQTAEVRLDAQNGKVLIGEVSQIANIGEQTDRREGTVFRIVIDIVSADSTLRPALTTSTTILVDEHEAALSLPLESVHTADSISFVFIRDNGHTYRKEVLIGLTNENEAEILSTLDPEIQVYLTTPQDPEDIPLHQLGN